MTRYEKAHPGEENKLLDFANYVFSQAHRPHDFRTLLPKVYGEGVLNASIHYVAHDEIGDIRAMIAALPQHLSVCGRKLFLGSVGTVSVHPYARGEGHMKHLMKLMEDDCRAQGMDALVLGGRRQRYNYFGFEEAGANALFTVDRVNLRHALDAQNDTPFHFVQLSDNCDPLVQKCFELYQKGPVNGARPREEYLRYMHSWQGELYAVMKNDAFAGALQICGQVVRNIGELLLNDENDLPAVLKKWLVSHPEMDSVSITAWPFEKQRIAILEGFAEDMCIGHGQMIRILNFKNVLNAVMTLNALSKPLENGSVVMKADGQQFRLTVRDGVVSVEDTSDAPDITLDALSAERLLFLPTRFLLSPNPAFKNWLPLPWVMPVPDRF